MFRVAVLALLAVAASAADLVTKTEMGSKTHFMVDWKKGPDVSYEMEDFKVGDMITFRWTSYHDAVIVPHVNNPCDLVNMEAQYIKVLSAATEAAEVTHTITSGDPFWVICTVGQHCASGNQKIMFMLDGTSHTPNSTVTLNSTMNGNSSMSMTPPRAPMTNGTRSSNGVEGTRAALSSIFGVAFLAALFA